MNVESSTRPRLQQMFNKGVLNWIYVLSENN